MSDVYTPPQAELHDEVAAGQYGSVEQALLGNYRFHIGEILKEAWGKTNGAKTTIFVAAFIPVLISMVIGFASAMMFQGASGFSVVTREIVIQLLNAVIAVPMYAGLLMIGVKRSVNAPVQIGQIFQHWNKTLPLLGLYILMYVLIFIGLLLLVLPGIYLMIAYSMAIPLMIEKDMGIWESLETSRKAVTKKWFNMFGLGILSMIIAAVGAIALLVGLFWTIPLVMIAYGIAYRNMFGVESETLRV